MARRFAIRRNAATETLWKLHRAVFKLSGGLLGGSVQDMPVLLLRSMGRRSGRPHDVVLSYLDDDGRYVVVASNAGEDDPPGWWLNLQSDPAAAVLTRDGGVVPVRAYEADGDERNRLWREIVAANDAYATYQERTDRPLPVVVLEPLPD